MKKLLVISMLVYGFAYCEDPKTYNDTDSISIMQVIGDCYNAILFDSVKLNCTSCSFKDRFQK